MNYLITGGAGFIGSHLAKKLINQDCSVTIIDTLDSQIHGENPYVNIDNRIIFKRISVTEICEHIDLIEAADVIVHLAAQTGTGQSMYDIRRYVFDNEYGTAVLLEAISKSKNKPKKLVLSSSRSVYGEGAYINASGELVQPLSRSKEQLEKSAWDFEENGCQLNKHPTPESLAAAPGSIYAATKLNQEYLCQSASEALGLDVSILRFQNVYGEGQSLQNPYTGIISIFFNRARQGLGLSIFEDGEETRDFVHVSDVVDAILSACNTKTKNEIYNIGSGIATSVNVLAEALCQINKFDVEIKITGQYRLGDIRHNYADLKKAETDLNFKPKVNFHDGLKRFSNWAIEQPVYQDLSAEALKELKDKGLGK